MRRQGGNKCIILSEKSHSKMATYCMFPTIWLSEKENTMETIKRSMVARDWSGERDEEVEHRIFRAVWYYMVYTCMILWCYIHVIIHLSKFIEYNTKSKPKCNLQTLICHCRSINCNKWTTLGGDVDNGRGYECVRERVMWEISVPSPFYES